MLLSAMRKHMLMVLAIGAAAGGGADYELVQPLSANLMDLTYFLQHQVAVDPPQPAALHGVHKDPNVVQNFWMLTEEYPIPEPNPRKGTGRLHRMVKKSRWIGWKHLSEGHHTDGSPSHKEINAEMGTTFFNSAPPQEWIILAVVCVVLCFIDVFLFRRAPATFRWHLVIICAWAVLAALYLWGVWARMGKHFGIEWISGYILEWMLSMDNLFIFHLVFTSYKTPQEQVHKAVFVGIIGAVVMRLIFFLVVSTLLHAVGWFRYPFGVMLIWSGIEAVRSEDDDVDVKDTRLVRALRYCCGDRILDGYDKEGTRIFLWDKKNDRLQLSLLFVVIFIVEFSDIVFALDSVSAKVAQIPNQYIAFSSSVMAMYGLRAMFFVIQDLVEMFDLLKYGLCLILVFIGLELMVGRWMHISSGVECAIIVGVFAICILASALMQFYFPPKEETEEEAKDDEDDTKDPAEAVTEPAKTSDSTKPHDHPAGPLDGLRERPEGEEVEASGLHGAWTIHEGRKSMDDKWQGTATTRSKSEPK